MPATSLLAPLLALLVPAPQDVTPRTRELLSPLRGTRVELDAADLGELAASGALQALGERTRTHASAVRSVSLDGAGARALSVGSVGDAALTRTADGESVTKRDLVAEDDSAACVVARFLGDGSSAVCLWSDRTARFVDTGSFTETRRFDLGAPCRDVLVSADGRVLLAVPPLDGAGASAVRAFDVATGKVIDAAEVAGGRVLSAALARDGKHVALVALVGRQRMVVVRALVANDGFGPPLYPDELAELLTAEASFEPTAAPIALSHDGGLLALGAGGKVLMFDLTRGRAMRALDESDPSWSSATRALAFDGRGTRLAAGASDGSIITFDIAARKRLRQALAHAADVTSVDLSEDGKTCLSGASDGSLSLRNAETCMPLHARGANVGSAQALAFALDSADKLYCGGYGGACLEFEGTTGVPRPLSVALGEDIVSLARNAESVLAATSTGVHEMLPVAVGGIDVAMLASAATPLTAFAATRGGTLFVTGHAEGAVRLWRARAGPGTELRGEAPVQGPVVALGCAPDGATVLALASDGGRRAWHVDGARLLHDTLGGSGPLPRSIAWLDAERVAVGYADGTAHIERLDGASLAALSVDGDTRLGPSPTQGRTDGAPALAGSPEGAYVAALVATHGLVLWEVESGALALQVRYAARPASALAFSDDGTRLVAGHRDGSLTSIDLAALAEWLSSAERAGAAAGGDAVAEAAEGAALPTLGGEGLAPNSAPPRPDPDATRVRRRNAVPFDARLAAAEGAAERGEDDVAEEQLFRALADLAFDPDSASRAARAASVHQRLAALPGVDTAALGAVADLYVELARAYQRKSWAEVGGLCLDFADVYGPGKGDRVRVALGRGKPAANAGSAQKKPPAKPAPKPAAAPKDAAASGGLALVAPHSGWKIEGQKVLALPGPDDPVSVLVDSAPSEDVRIEVVVEASGSRRNEFGVIFGATEGIGSGFALVVLHAEHTNVIQAALCELRSGRIGDRIAQRKMTLDAVPKEWHVGVEVKADSVTLDVAGQAKFTIPLERPAHGHHGFMRLAGGAKATVFQRTRIDPPPGFSAATEAKLGPPKVAPDASVEERIVAAEAHVPFAVIEGAVAHLWRAERLLPFLVDESVVPGLAARIGALLATHDPLTVRRDRAREDAAAALVALARARFDAGRPAASLALFELARQVDVLHATEPLESARPGLDLALAKARGAPGEAPRALDNAQLEAWFAAEDSREEFWVGGWSTVGASLASPLLVDASSLLRSRKPLPEGTQELSVEVRMEQRGAAGLALGCGDDGSFLAITFDPEDPESSITVARWTGAEGQGWDQRAAVRQRYSPEAQDGWTTIHVRLEGTRVTARIGRGEPVSAQVPNRWVQGPPGFLAIGQHGPQRVRFRNLVVR